MCKSNYRLAEVDHRSSTIDFLGMECWEIKPPSHPMSLTLIRLLFDLGLLVLIWLVQLVIYPSFLYYERDNLRQWHYNYTKKVIYVVLPLMMGQFIIAGIHLFNDFSIFTLVSFLIIVSLWIITFFIFVPLHNKVSTDVIRSSILNKLVQLNWIRTVLWSGLFISNLLYYLTSKAIQ